MSQFCTAARQCLDTQGHTEHLRLPERFQQLPTMHRCKVDVYDFCSNGEPSSARPLAILSISADPSQWTTTFESAGSRAPFGSGTLSASRS